MKSIKNLSFLNYFFIFIKCSSDKSKDSNLLENVNLNEEDKIIFTDEIETTEEPIMNHGLLSFSFDKECFTNFECEINDLYLSSEVAKKPQIYYNNPNSIFIYVFCLFFQYFELKNNDEFKRIVEEQFICHQFKIYFLKNYLSHLYVYDPKTFDEHLSKLDCFIKNILEGKCPNMVTVKEENGRMLITPTNLTNCHLKSLEEFSMNYHDCYLNIEIETLIMEIYWRYYYKTNSLISCSCNFQENQSASTSLKQCKPCKDLSDTLRTLILNIVSLIDVKKGLSAIKRNRTFDNDLKYFSIFTIKCSNDDLFGHVSEIIYKLKVKSLNENMIPHAKIFLIFPEERMESLFILRNVLKQSLKNDTKIKFSTKLSNRSIDTLVMNCLLLDG